MSFNGFLKAALIVAPLAAIAEKEHGVISNFFNPCSDAHSGNVTMDSSYGDRVRASHCGERRGLGFGNGAFDAGEDLKKIRPSGFNFD